MSFMGHALSAGIRCIWLSDQLSQFAKIVASKMLVVIRYMTQKDADNCG